MRNLTKQFAILTIGILLLSGCSKKAPPELSTEPEPTREAVAETVADTVAEEAAAIPSAEPLTPSMEQQADVMWNSRDIWMLEDFSEYDRYFYTFTDLDHNGRMEVIAAITQGTGIFTSGQMFEVNPDFDGVALCRIPENLPEIIISAAECYQEGDLYHYAFSDTTRVGGGESGQALVWLTLENGDLTETILAWNHILSDWNTGTVTTTYSNDAGEITEDDFLMAYETAGRGMIRSMAPLDWKPGNEFSSAADILACFERFSGKNMQLRPLRKDLVFWLEGMEETVSCELFTGQNYSIYIPEEDWTYQGKLVYDRPADSWVSDYNDQVELSVIQMTGFTRHQAGLWVLDHFPEYDLIWDKAGGIGGISNSGDVLDVQLLPVRDGYCAVAMFYPMEAAEGFGTRLQVLADSFEML